MNRRDFFKKAFSLVSGVLTAAVVPLSPRRVYRYGGSTVKGYINFPPIRTIQWEEMRGMAITFKMMDVHFPRSSKCL